ncbi:MAG: hypothetical protein KKC85_19710 [Gammaproteobacteria bacterium]|nr:hypothetical protein [Gammaproteobacteria bacterium]MBU1440334.1 hypothetical protein [Gammaproteobacteria bacterium]MBU2288636.1 hypothetical protein [Gammaproteobacteria bacterium]
MRRAATALATTVASIALAGCAALGPTCPASALDLPPQALYGHWQARFDGSAETVELQLAPHPEYAGVRGSVRRTAGAGPATTAQLAGDVNDEGQLALDESVDGREISGVWVAELASQGCGTQLRGTRRNAADESIRSFTMIKIEAKQ